MLTERTEYQTEITENDAVQVRARTYIYRDGELLTHSNHRHVIQPGDDYSKEPGKVRRMCEATFVPTVVDRHLTSQLYEQAKQERDEAIAAKEAAEQAREKALAAYAEAQESGVAEDIEQAKAARDEAKAARDKAVTEMEQAIAARDAAREARDAARQAHEDFIAAEG